MKKIGLMSDTHSYLDPKVFTYFKDVDEIWHAGDLGKIELIDELEKFKPTRGVYGNIDNTDVRATWPKVNEFTVEGVKVLMTHIAGKPYKYNKEAYAEIQKSKPQLFICGHSHIALAQFDKSINSLWLNPGACGFHGFHKVKTLMRFELNAGKIENLELIEIGPRTSSIPDFD
ncbi:metallophosphoesterase family protein [Crocinitomix catalasitica]|uniref:metallophosphoesterase family protein n=1 Tax=Crocinitomix catalasitica TaxID=184607 RepID=UPI000485908D|nr:metallophosphoesterase family protein [Crocinitomix catalasitica]